MTNHAHTNTDIRAAITVLVPDNRMEAVQNTDTLASLGVDCSSRRAQLQYGLEARYNIDIDEGTAVFWETVGDVVRDVQNMLISNPTVQIEPKQPINRIERADVEFFRTVSTTDKQGISPFDLYQKIATKSAIYPGKGTPFGLMYAALGLAEAGEVQNKVKKAFRDDGVINIDVLPEGKVAAVSFQSLTSERHVAIIKELGGVLWYIAAVCDEIGATMSEVALQNLEELCGRGERNTLRGDGDNR